MPPSVCEGSGEKERKFTQVLRPGSQKKYRIFLRNNIVWRFQKAFSGTKNAVNGKLQVNLTRKIRYRDLWRKKSIFDAFLFFPGKARHASQEREYRRRHCGLAGTIRLIIWKRRRRRLGLMIIRECGWVGEKKGNRKSTSFTQKKKSQRTYRKERKEPLLSEIQSEALWFLISQKVRQLFF